MVCCKTTECVSHSDRELEIVVETRRRESWAYESMWGAFLSLPYSYTHCTL